MSEKQVNTERGTGRCIYNSSFKGGYYDTMRLFTKLL